MRRMRRSLRGRKREEEEEDRGLEPCAVEDLSYGLAPETTQGRRAEVKEVKFEQTLLKSNEQSNW